MGKTYDVYRYSYAVVIVIGILGNILVIISILRQKKLLKNNYYFLVQHLAICDLGPLIILLLNHINWYLVEDRLVIYSTKFTKYCVFIHIYFVFRVAGIGMMLIISLLRYRTTVHPLKPDVSRRKLKVVCGLVYIVGFIAGFMQHICRYVSCSGTMSQLFMKKFFMVIPYHAFTFSQQYLWLWFIFKICRELMKQNKYMKNVCSNPGSSFNILKFIRNRRTFFVCLITVLCYTIGNIPNDCAPYFIHR
jgi:hypothetical protein